ncbi:MAG: aminotransferase class III-fold pyridoxal phosphate-dependent enzyme, partial [Bdellovibrionales bacterium]|nr:aminotransferase class III-fold pyridoxal phosphate-dependent enzyme [Bdellovibrionales bacterium]
EVQTGVGRTGENFFAIEDSNITPDIITMAKGLGSGAPIGALIAKSEVADSLKGKLHFNTFGGDPYQSMQASTVIDIIKEEELIKNAKEQGSYLKDSLNEMKKEFPMIGDVRGRGLLLGIEMVKDPITKEIAPQETARLMDLTKDEKLLLGKGGLYGNIVRLAPSLTITRKECDQLLSRFANALRKL